MRRHDHPQRQLQWLILAGYRAQTESLRLDCLRRRGRRKEVSFELRRWLDSGCPQVLAEAGDTDNLTAT